MTKPNRTRIASPAAISLLAACSFGCADADQPAFPALAADTGAETAEDAGAGDRAESISALNQACENYCRRDQACDDSLHSTVTACELVCEAETLDVLRDSASAETDIVCIQAMTARYACSTALLCSDFAAYRARSTETYLCHRADELEVQTCRTLWWWRD